MPRVKVLLMEVMTMAKSGINSTQSVNLINNVIRSSVRLFNTNNINIIDNFIGTNSQGMPTTTYSSQSISISHNSIDDSFSDNILIQGNLLAGISAGSPMNNLNIDNNTICFSPYMQAGVQEYMNLCSSSAPIYFSSSKITNFNFTNNKIDLGRGESGFALEPKPSYIDTLIYMSSSIDNLFFDNNQVGTAVGLKDDLLFKKCVY